MMESNTIYHEKQILAWCALHTINNLLQNRFFTVSDLNEIAKELDAREKSLLETDSRDGERSSNFDYNGNFSIQVITVALSLYGLELVPFNSTDPRAESARKCTAKQQGFICNVDNHWFPVCKINGVWYQIDSLEDEVIQLKDDGIQVCCFATEHEIKEYSGIFIVVGDLDQVRNMGIRAQKNDIVDFFREEKFMSQGSSSKSFFARPVKLFWKTLDSLFH